MVHKLKTIISKMIVEIQNQTKKLHNIKHHSHILLTIIIFTGHATPVRVQKLRKN